MKFVPNVKDIRTTTQQAVREHHLYWGRFKFIHAGYLPKRFAHWQASFKGRRFSKWK